MTARRLKVSVVGKRSVAVDDLEKLPSLTHQSIYVEKAEFRDVMTINRVAVTLGKSVRHLRRMIESGEFPPSCMVKGQTHYWLRQTVRDWKKSSLQSPAVKQPAIGAKPRRWSSVDEIVTEEETEFRRKASDTQALMNGVREMEALFASDPKEFERRHPNLKKWLTKKSR